MTQPHPDKCAAIASVLWLLPCHYSMIRITRSGVHFANEIEAPELPGWTPQTPEEFEGWPVEEVLRWHAYQRHLSHKYHLWPLSRAFEWLEAEHPEWAVALATQYVEAEPLNWYEPERVSDRCRDGLAFLAERVGDMPFFQEAVVQVRPRPRNVVSRNQRIVEMHEDGIGKKKIAAELRCSLVTVKAVIRGQVVRRGRIKSATST